MESYPSGPLANYVKSFWRMSCSLPCNQKLLTRDIPNGDLHVLFNLGTPFKSQKEGVQHEFTGGIIKGQQTSFLQMVQSDGFDGFGISFYPWGLSPFINLPTKELYNLTVDVNDVFDPTLPERLYGLAFKEQQALIESFLIKKLKDYRSKSPLVEFISADVIHKKGQVSISSYNEKHNISQKHLSRCFHELIGLTPKKLAKLSRVNAVIEDINKSNDPVDWMELVLKNHYHDQAHMIKEFKQVVGLSPNKFMNTADTLYHRFSAHLLTLG
ncbi:DUF6597 domain-containing transcriptional factor [Aquiflexum sp.]|uniref:DUF6597 domain-containing transcriptional factor n=1 Tax=Aquiflexum sp. TaxID=1872584 RepID=UPI003594406D